MAGAGRSLRAMVVGAGLALGLMLGALVVGGWRERRRPAAGRDHLAEVARATTGAATSGTRLGEAVARSAEAMSEAASQLPPQPPGDRPARVARRPERLPGGGGPGGRHGGGALATLAWLVLVVGVLFFGLTSAQQRARLLQAVQTGRAQLGELYRDFQGYRDDL